MIQKNFEQILDHLCSQLLQDITGSEIYPTSADFELKVREKLNFLLTETDLKVDFKPHPHVFPDIALPPFGVEIKFTLKDTWRSVANSVFESTRFPGIEKIYLIFGKMGGIPGVEWRPYGESVVHVRTSHVPRFEVEINATRSLFQTLEISYESFADLPEHEKMEHIREYARARLKAGERLWWLENLEESEHSLPLQARIFTALDAEEKRKLRAEAAILSPQVVKPSRSRGKYNDVSLYLLTYHGVIAPQVRDLFSAGSVALRADSTRGGNYLCRALVDIEDEMAKAAEYLPMELIKEYWGVEVEPNERVQWWLKKADALAKSWKPSEHLFKRF